MIYKEYYIQYKYNSVYICYLYYIRKNIELYLIIYWRVIEVKLKYSVCHLREGNMKKMIKITDV